MILSLLKILKYSANQIVESLSRANQIADAAQRKDEKTLKRLVWQTENDGKHLRRKVSSILSPSVENKSAYDPSLDVLCVEKNNESLFKNDFLKNKGDEYERSVGLSLEDEGFLVIYNGLIRGYGDKGIDVIAISESRKEIRLIQCKNWMRREFKLTDFKRVICNLERFYTTDYFDIPVSTINYFLHIKKSEIDIVRIIEESEKYERCLYLYLSNEGSVSKSVFDELNNSGVEGVFKLKYRSHKSYNYSDNITVLIVSQESLDRNNLIHFV